MKLFSKIVDCIQLMTIFGEHFILRVSHDFEYASDKTKQNTGVFSFISHKFILKFNFIFTLLPCTETLLITNSIHVSFISSWFTHAAEYLMILISHYLPVQTHHNNFRLTFSRGWYTYDVQFKEGWRVGGNKAKRCYWM